MTLTSLGTDPWDVLIVGAGPAGATAAYLLARRGRRVLLVDHARFPREKVCGCCLGARGVRICRGLGLGQVLMDGVPLHAVELRHSQRALRLAIPVGVAMSRSALDNGLVGAAVAAGATFVDACNARLLSADGEHRSVQLTQQESGARVQASLVLACDGIHGRLLDDEPACAWRIAPDAWMGAAVTLSDEAHVVAAQAASGPPTEARCPRNIICMHLAAGGYVGAVRMPDGRLHLAAALDPRICREAGGPSALMRRILRDAADWDIPSLDHAKPLGSPLLTRSRSIFGARRVLAVGDACGYVEPFTGEGMTWAIESANCLAQFLPASLKNWSDYMPKRWTSVHGRMLGGEQSLCNLLRWLLHQPMLSCTAMRLAGWFPAIGRAAVNRLESGSEVLA